jgi:D-arginine dehydrogenase
VLRADYVAGGVLEPDSKEIDVASLHQGYLGGLRGNGGKLVTNAEVKELTRAENMWRAETTAGQFEAPVVLNAAGAWCDVVAKLAGVAPIGLVPKRRTAFIFDAPDDAHADQWPLFADVDEDFYVKPDAGRLMGSPADETPIEPCDVYPEEIDIAIAADRIMKATTMEIRHIRNKWAGLRSFVADKTLVAGFEPNAEGFFWLAGQGGYGIQTAPAMSRIAAALATGQAYPETVAAFGTTEQDLTPARFR